MIVISQETLNLILLEVSLKIADRETMRGLVTQAKGLAEEYHLFMGVGEVDYLLMLRGAIKTHPIINLPNVRLINVLRCHGVEGYSDYRSETRPDAVTLLCCAKLNPKVVSHHGFSSISKFFLSDLFPPKAESSTEDPHVDVYLTLGWPDLIILVTSQSLRGAFKTILRIRNLQAKVQSQKHFLFSTTFSHLLIRCTPGRRNLTIDGNLVNSEFDFFTKIYCKPGGHLSISSLAKEQNPYFMLGKKDIGFVARSEKLLDYLNFLVNLRKNNQKTIWATKTDVLIKP